MNKVCASNPLNPFGMLQRLIDTVMGKRIPIVMGKNAATDGKRIILPPTIKTGTDTELVRVFFLSMHELAHNLNESEIKGAPMHRYQGLMHQFYNCFADICDERAFEKKYPGMRGYSQTFYTDLLSEPDQKTYYTQATKASGIVPYLQALTRYAIMRVRGGELGVSNLPDNKELQADYDTYIKDLEPDIYAMRKWMDASRMAKVFMDRVERLIIDEMERKAQQQKQKEQKNDENRNDDDTGDPSESQGEGDGSDDAGKGEASADAEESGGVDDDASGNNTDDAPVSDDAEGGESSGSDDSSPSESDDGDQDGEPSKGTSSDGCADNNSTSSDEGSGDDTGNDSDPSEDRASSDDEANERDDDADSGEDTAPGSGSETDDDESGSDPASDDESEEDKSDGEGVGEGDDASESDDPEEEGDGVEDDEDLPPLTDEERSAAREKARSGMEEFDRSDDPMSSVEDIKRGIEADFVNSGEYVKSVDVVDKIIEALPVDESCGLYNKKAGLELLGPEASSMVNLFMNNTKPHTVRYQKRGRMDFRRINDPRDGLDVKTKTFPGTLEQSAVMLMVDYSGSMSMNGKDVIASQLTSGLLYTLDRGAVPCAAFGYTDELAYSVSDVERNYPIRIEIIKRFEEQYAGKVMCRCNDAHYANFTPDLDAMREYAIPQLLARREANKVLLVICDGIPESYSPILTDRMRYSYIKYICAVKESGIKVFAFGIGTNLSIFFGKDWMEVTTTTLGKALVDKLRECLFRKEVLV